MDQYRRGPRFGTRPRGNTATYDPASGQHYATSTRFEPDDAVKLIKAAEVLGVSVAEIMRRAVHHMAVDETGRPTWPSDDTDAETSQLELLSPQPVDVAHREEPQQTAA